MKKMDALKWMEERHSVRRYLDKPIPANTAMELKSAVAQVNEASGLHIQLFLNEPKAFTGFLAHYGSFRNANNYFAIVGPESAQEQAGYWGEALVLKAQQLGLNTCWVALTFKKKEVQAVIPAGEKLLIVIALGYGETPGKPHKNKPVEKLAQLSQEDPDWYRKGVEAALLAPTAVNQQHFRISRSGDRVSLISTGGACSEIDLGIVKYHFEQGAGKDHFEFV